MASSLTKLLMLRRVPRALRPLTSTQRSHVFSSSSSLFITEASKCTSSPSLFDYPFRNFCSRPSNLDGEFYQGPATIDYSSILQEDEFHNLADSTIHDLLEKIEEYGDFVEIDGFDIDYGNQVLTVKLGSMGTYVLNKQTPNRQIWMSSPVSGPSRFDWNHNAQAWIYRRNKADLLKTLENEIEKLCDDVLDGLVVSLRKFTNLVWLLSVEESVLAFGEDTKARKETTAVFTIANMYGDYIRSGWGNILDCVLSLHKLGLLPACLASDAADHLEPTSDLDEGKPVLDSPGTSNKPSSATPRKLSGLMGRFSILLYDDTERPAPLPTEEQLEFHQLSIETVKDCHIDTVFIESFCNLSPYHTLLVP